MVAHARDYILTEIGSIVSEDNESTHETSFIADDPSSVLDLDDQPLTEAATDASERTSSQREASDRPQSDSNPFASEGGRYVTDTILSRANEWFIYNEHFAEEEIASFDNLEALEHEFFAEYVKAGLSTPGYRGYGFGGYNTFIIEYAHVYSLKEDYQLHLKLYYDLVDLAKKKGICALITISPKVPSEANKKKLVCDYGCFQVRFIGSKSIDASWIKVNMPHKFQRLNSVVRFILFDISKFLTRFIDNEDHNMILDCYRPSFLDSRLYLATLVNGELDIYLNILVNDMLSSSSILDTRSSIIKWKPRQPWTNPLCELLNNHDVSLNYLGVFTSSQYLAADSPITILIQNEVTRLIVELAKSRAEVLSNIYTYGSHMPGIDKFDNVFNTQVEQVLSEKETDVCDVLYAALSSNTVSDYRFERIIQAIMCKQIMTVNVKFNGTKAFIFINMLFQGCFGNEFLLLDPTFGKAIPLHYFRVIALPSPAPKKHYVEIRKLQVAGSRRPVYQDLVDVPEFSGLILQQQIETYAHTVLDTPEYHSSSSDLTITINTRGSQIETHFAEYRRILENSTLLPRLLSVIYRKRREISNSISQ